FNLRNSSWCRRDASQFELSKKVIILCHGSLSFINLNQDSGLVVRVGSKDLRVLGWNSSVPLNESSHDSTGCFNTKRKRSNIKEQEILNRFILISVQDCSLDGSTIGNGFIGIDALVQFLSVK